MCPYPLQLFRFVVMAQKGPAGDGLAVALQGEEIAKRRKKHGLRIFHDFGTIAIRMADLAIAEIRFPHKPIDQRTSGWM
ncbi:hypothetical protein CCGE525_37375 (plasmid) [Rhizobium jaguaris]|uniref:Uncharacterized protein n=1 Tax=Rhizobium jaguaris TaxID=1312183 RepID=A0A387G1I6_9HYPH|nr:hypothetical protein CCGE525_37375 [Rhizobium jaguaris]